MSFDLQEHLPHDFSPESKVWIYQSSRLFSISEALKIEAKLKAFIEGWLSHGQPVKGYANLFFGRFIIFMADESSSQVSGCSTDSSVKVIKEIEKELKTDMFNRQLLAFLIKDKVEMIPLSQLPYALEHGLVQPDTLFFDNTVLHKKELEVKWIKPLKSSWLYLRYQNHFVD